VLLYKFCYLAGGNPYNFRLFYKVKKRSPYVDTMAVHDLVATKPCVRPEMTISYGACALHAG
jgi:hypothetical protein